MSMNKKASQLYCRKIKSGKKPLWHATMWPITIAGLHIAGIKPGYIIGAGNTADNAIKDYKKQARKMDKQDSDVIDAGLPGHNYSMAVVRTHA